MRKTVARLLLTAFASVLFSSIPGRAAHIVSLSGGFGFSVASDSRGKTWAWGANHLGQLGIGIAGEDVPVPVQVSGLSDVVQVSAGSLGCHTLALKRDGTVWAWGCNFYGQLGDGTTEHKPYPVQVPGLSGVIKVAAGAGHSLALKEDGSVWAWGQNNYGQVGDGTDENKLLPVKIMPFGASDIAAGDFFSMAYVFTHSAVAYWGRGTSNNYYSPWPIALIPDVVQVAAGGGGMFLRKSDGTVLQRKPASWEQVSGLSNVVDISVGDAHVLALRSDGTVWAWEGNSYGQLGNGTNQGSAVPVQALLPPTAKIGAGSFHSLAYTTDGRIWAWGRGSDGELGNGIFADQNIPVQVLLDLSEPALSECQENQTTGCAAVTASVGQELTLSVTPGTVDFGTVHPSGSPFEMASAVLVEVKSNVSWAARHSQSPPSGSAAQLPPLEWREEAGSWQEIPLQPAEFASGSDTAGDQHLISYRLSVPFTVPPGQYQGTVVYEVVPQ